MRLTDILPSSRIAISSAGESTATGPQILAELATLLSNGVGEGQGVRDTILANLLEREHLQSTGIGEGVAIPHTAVESVEHQRAALLLCPKGVGFDAIDGQPVYIFFGVVGPKCEASTHLKILAKISRLLRSPETRRRLLESTGPEQAYSLIEEHEDSSINP